MSKRKIPVRFHTTGEKNNGAGTGLLIASGATGITGTNLMVDAFKYLERAGRKNRVP